eukprot:COSAG06_NODE_6165_length_3074_cov_7.266218_1_plen_82_part_10
MTFPGYVGDFEPLAPHFYLCKRSIAAPALARGRDIATRTDLGRASGSKCPTSRIDFLPFSTTIENVRAHFLAMMIPPAPRAH